MSAMSQHEEEFSFALSLPEPSRSEALLALAKEVRLTKWHPHTEPVALELARLCEAKAVTKEPQ